MDTADNYLINSADWQNNSVYLAPCLQPAVETLGSSSQLKLVLCWTFSMFEMEGSVRLAAWERGPYVTSQRAAS